MKRKINQEEKRQIIKEASEQGIQAADGSPWENQALWDFNNRALPAINVFAE